MLGRNYFVPKEAEYFGTPAYAIYPILKYIPRHVKTIWEPTAGQHNISSVLRKEGFTVVTTDLYPQSDDITRMDFLNDVPDFDYDMIILNPPFKKTLEFMDVLYKQNKPFMFIAPSHTINSSKRHKMFKKNSVNQIVFDLRVEYTERGSCPYYSSWFLGNVPMQNKLIFEKLNKSIKDRVLL